MNAELVNLGGFADRDLRGIDRWQESKQADISYFVRFSFTWVGTPDYSLRWRIVGKQCFFQVKFNSSTSVATTAGTSYMILPVPAKGIAGSAVMTNDTTNIAVGLCHIDITNSYVYPPTQAASADTFTIAGWYEV